MNIPRDSLPSLNQLSAELSLYGRIDHCSSEHDNPSCQHFNDHDTTALPSKKKKFPKQLKAFLQFIPGNDRCPDCDLRAGRVDTSHESKYGLPSKGDCMSWANVECGSLICEECAGYHIRLNRRTSSILSLDESNWSLPQILSVLEGGNQNFLSALNKIDRQNDYLRKSRMGFGVRNLMTENEKDCHPFEHRYKYNTKVESYKVVLASRVVDACKENAGAEFAEENTTKIIPEGDINNGTSLATYLVHKSKNGKLKGDEPTCSLLKENEPNGSKSRQKSSFRGEKRSKPKSTHSSESRAVNNFFHRIFEAETKQSLHYNEAVNSRIYSNSEVLDQCHNKVDESKSRPFQEQQDYPTKKDKHQSMHIKWDDKQRYYSGGTVKDDKRHHISSKIDLPGWSYQKSSGQSQAFKQATKRLSIDSLISPILMEEESNSHSMKPHPMAA